MEHNIQSRKLVRPLFVIMLVWLVSIGCAATNSPANPPPTTDSVETAVAATLQSIEATPAEPTAAITAQTITETVSPTVTVAATAPAIAEATAEPSPGLIEEGRLVVAYVDPTRDVWVWEAGSEPRRIISTGDVDAVQISDDGAWIAFTRTTDYVRYSLWVVQSGGAEQRPVMDLPDFEALPRPAEAVSVLPATFDWVPGAHILGFNTRPAFEGPGLMLNNDLWMADIDDNTFRQMLGFGDGGQFYFSPDGSQIALVQPDSISLVNTDGSNRRERVFVYPQVTTYSEYAFYAHPQWAADSSNLMVVIPPPAALDRPEDPATVWRIPTDGSPAVLTGSFHSAPFFAPVLAPNLEQLAYLTQVGAAEENRRALHIAQVDGADDTVYVEDQFLWFHAWATDSQRFIYTVGEAGQRMIGELGGAPRSDSEGFNAAQLRWVDANQYLFVTQTGPNQELHLRTVAGGETVIASFSEETNSMIFYDFNRQ